MTIIDELQTETMVRSEALANVATEAAVSLTPAAASRIKILLEDEAQPMFFRVYITGGGCAGFQYGFSFDKSTKPDDILETHISATGQELQVLVDPLSLMYLQGAQIDYQEGLQGSYFKVINPNAKTTCGCGSSFSI